MRPLLSAVLLAASPAWAVPPERVCRYHEDVSGVSRALCDLHHQSLPEAARAQAERLAPARESAVRALIAAFRADPGGLRRHVEAARLDPPFNGRTIPAWLEEPLEPVALATLESLYPAAREARQAQERLRRSVLAAQRPRLDGRLADGAAGGRAMDGSLERAPVLADPSVPGRIGSQRPPLPDERPLRPGTRVSDLAVAEPPAAGVPRVEPRLPRPLTRGEPLELSIDRGASACSDFFQFACGRWLREHGLRGAQRSRMSELNDRNNSRVGFLAEELAAGRREMTPDERRLGDYFAACMDRKAVDKRGLAPLRADLARIKSVTDPRSLAAVLGELHAQSVPGFFRLGADQDLRDPREIIAVVRPSGGSLPRAYYLDEAHRRVRDAYAAFIAAQMRLLGESREGAGSAAAGVLRVETMLARGMLVEEAQRDAENSYHRGPVSALSDAAPAFPWDEYFESSGTPALSELNVAEPRYLRAFDEVLRTLPPEDWRAYLAWRLLQDSQNALPSEFQQAARRFSDAFWGTDNASRRWTEGQQSYRCIDELGLAMGDAVGVAYVRAHFDPRAKAAVERLAEAIRAAVLVELERADWMRPETRAEAARKARAMRLKVGYPEKPRGYAELHVARGDHFGNMRRAGVLQRRRDLARIGRPRDPDRFGLPAHIVNAYYDAQNNEVVVPAGILQPPYFDLDGPDAVNFGGIGAIIGHELVHGFDDEGRKFDAEGRKRDWWTPQDAAAYESRAGAFVRQYQEHHAVPGRPDGPRVNARLTLGENIADNGGLRMAYNAFIASPASREPIEGFSAEQAFFLGFARGWCGHETEQSALASVATDPHAPQHVRVNATVANMPEFRRAFACREGDAMVNPAPSRVW